MWQHVYVSEKLRELQEAAPARRVPAPPSRGRKPVIGPIARRAGRALRRVGEGLESWGAPPPRERARRHQFR
jgi:hypothetical protein